MEQIYKLKTKDNKGYQMEKNNINIPPGQLQYKVKKEHIIEFDIDIYKITCINIKDGFILEQHTKENLLRLIPNTPSGNALKQYAKIILIIKAIENNNICLKGAILNTMTGEIALMTSIPIDQEYHYRTIKSNDINYKVCQCKMIAPLFFWEELKNRLLY